MALCDPSLQGTRKNLSSEYSLLYSMKILLKFMEAENTQKTMPYLSVHSVDYNRDICYFPPTKRTDGIER